jgi:hypothetical protein
MYVEAGRDALVLEGFLMLLGAGATMAAGIPIAVRLARAGFAEPLTDSGMADFGAGRDASTSAGFTPLDLGPDPVQWPSAKPWPTSKLPVPEWPSKSWDDEHFGRHWREGTSVAQPSSPAEQAARQASMDASDASRAQKQARSRDADRRAEQEEAQRRIAARQALEQRQAARAQQDARAKQAQQQSRPQPKATPKPKPKPKLQVAQPKPRPQAQRKQAAKPAAPDGAPGRDELMQLVDTVGLAGTVQEIMKRTGWDFRKAAQYLARVRSGG